MPPILMTLPTSKLATSHHVTSNVSNVPGGLARRYATRQLAQAAFDNALDDGQVIRVTYVVSKETLSR